jgi:PXA domain
LAGQSPAAQGCCGRRLGLLLSCAAHALKLPGQHDHVLEPLHQVIRMVSEGLAAFVLDRSDSSKTMIRSIARELLGSCVLRNLMFYFTPYTINKVLRGHVWLGTYP